MSVISDITSVIGLATKAVELADQLKNLDLKAIIVDLKGKLIDLKEEIIQLREENAELKRKMAEAPLAEASPKEQYEVMYGCYYFNGDPSKLYCPKCYEREEKKHRMQGVAHVGHKCTVCTNFIHRQCSDPRHEAGFFPLHARRVAASSCV